MNKKSILLSIIALNVITTPLLAEVPKYGKVYNQMIKNLENGRSNDESYKILNQILVQRNKELKDLYSQNNYIIKPEYLEWQFFFSGFYDNYGKGKDNTSENAAFSSKTEGYYDKNGNYIQTKSSVNGTMTKPYEKKQDEKYINLGIEIKPKEIFREDLNLSLSPISPVNLNLSIGNIHTPELKNIPAVNVPKFNISQPNINISTPAGINIVVPTLTTYTNWTEITGPQYADNTQFGNINFSSTTHRTSDGDNAIVQYTLSGDYYTDSNTVMYVDKSQTRAVTVDLTEDIGKSPQDVYTTFTNMGKIYLTATSTAGLEIQTDPRGLHPTIKNSGLIEGQGSSQAAMIFTPENSLDSGGIYIIENTADGKIVMKGDNSTGIAINKLSTSTKPFWQLQVTNNGLIEISGTNNYGMALKSNDLKPTSYILNNTSGIININGDNSGGIVLLNAIDNTNDNVVNKGNINLSSSGSFGIYSNISITRYVNEGNINLLSSNKSIGLRNEGGLLVNNNTGEINLTNGTDNIGLYNTGGITENKGKVEITNGVDNIGIYAKNLNTSIINSGDIIANSTSNVKGIVVTDSADVTNNGSIQLNGQSGSVGIYSDSGSFTSSGTGSIDIKISGANSTGLYASNNGTITTNGSIEASSGSVNLYASNNGKIILSNANLVTNSEALLFYSSNGGKFTLTNSTANIKNSGAAFYYDASSLGAINFGTISNYISNMFSPSSNSILNMSQDSIVTAISNANVNLSDLPNLNTVLNPIGINIIGTGYKNYLLYKSNLIVDQNTNVDTDVFGSLGLSATSITNNNNITGVLSDKVAIAVENEDLLSKNAVSLVNNGSISLTGNESIGIFANYGIINNNANKIINLSGEDSIGIYATNGTAVVNSGDIIVNGVGIYSSSYKIDGTAQTFGDGKTSIINSGTITSGSDIGSIGIYALNNSGGAVSSNDFTLDLSSGTINMKNSAGGTGVYTENAKVTDNGSSITVGENGVALYAKNSDINLNGTTINLFGNNAIGFYLDGTTNFNGTGIINIDGSNIILAVPGANATVSQNFTLGNVTDGSTYTLNALLDNTYTYTGTAGLGSNGTLVTGLRTATYIDSLGNITANPGAVKVGAIVLNGQYTAGGVLPVGMSSGIDGENAGTITLGDISAGLYGENGVRLSNKGIINVNENSGAIITSGTGSLGQNSGDINIGKSSQAIYVKNGDLINNMAAGTIKSSNSNAVGLFANTVNAVTNDGVINLSGEKSIGIYSTGANSTSITNKGVIGIGDSLNVSDPSIGIYSNSSDNITNNGTINSGQNSIGIYSNGGVINQNGILNVGLNGTGLYLVNGSINVNSGSTFNLQNNSVGVYAKNSNVSNTSDVNVGNSNYGFVLADSSFINISNNAVLGTDSVFAFVTNGTTVNNGNVTTNGSDNIIFYTTTGARMENYGIIAGVSGTSNISIYNEGGSVLNDTSGIITVGDSVLNDKTYAVGIYGKNSIIDNLGTISSGSGGIGIGTEGGSAKNAGNITSTGRQSIGMYTENGTIVNDQNGLITVSGVDAIGMAGKGSGSQIINNGIINVTGDNAKGMYGLEGATVINNGKIFAVGNNATGIVLDNKSTFIVSSTGEVITNNIVTGNNYRELPVYDTPEIINSGVIQVAEKFETDGINVIIKVDPSSLSKPEVSTIASEGYDSVDIDAEYLISNAVKIKAPSFSMTNAIEITGDYAIGTNLNKYKLSDVFVSGSDVINDSSNIKVKSKSLTWEATPVTNSKGNTDIWMTRISYTKFTDGLWYEDFGKGLDGKYTSATSGNSLKIYDKIDLIENESDFRHIMGSMAGNVYANINQRENDISRTFENSLDFIENSENNTKENVKINIIAGKGKNKEETDGVTPYDYTTTGVLALREVERTYKHKFGYSLGYLHTGFEFEDGNDSEEWVDTVQLGLHNKYSTNNWVLKNDLMGRVSFHNIDRNIDWPSPNNRSEMNGTYETYSITSDNKLGKEFEAGKKLTITPYTGLRVVYVTRPTFSESGLEALEVKGNNAWSVKPRAGVKLQTTLPLGINTGWQLKGTLDFAYEYELADLNEREKASLISIEDSYHNLSKPEDEKGTFRTKAAIGVETAGRYGFFLTGEYSAGNNKENDYRAGIALKALF